MSIGECMVEMAPTGVGTFQMGFAGDTLNTAWYARRCLPDNWQVSYCTAIGTDAISGQMLEFLEASGLTTDHIQKLKDQSVGLYMIQLENGERSFAYWRSQSAARQLADNPHYLAQAMAGTSLVYFSGITLAILPPDGRKNFLNALKSARSGGTKTAFDPNLRPRLWEDANSMRSVVTEAASVCDYVMPSFEDELAHFGDAAPSATAERYLSAGATMVVVKNGPEDVLCAGDDWQKSFQPANVSGIVDTTAAGDSFNAAFLAEHLTSGDVDKSVDAGAKLAGHVIRHRGALVDCSQTG
ncbi:sugar kinase [Roseibium denhamense]|nr:sugar kinase [Roseibium denhamense]MTI05075.1 sugar kinase [Roseibium denhamense]